MDVNFVLPFSCQVVNHGCQPIGTHFRIEPPDGELEVRDLIKLALAAGPSAVRSLAPPDVICWMLVPALSTMNFFEFVKNIQRLKLNHLAPQEPDAPVVLLNPFGRISTYFNSKRSPLDVHLVFQLHASNTGLSPSNWDNSALATSGSKNDQRQDWKDWKELWDIHWGKGDFETYIESHDSVHGKFKTMPMYPAFSKRSLKRLLIREEWVKILDHAQLVQREGASSLITIGYPGIGKTLSLYYFLLKRINHGLPTFFQNDPDSVWFFHQGGLSRIHRKLPWKNVKQANYTGEPIWALVDSNRCLEAPATVLWAGDAPIFVVQAASPRYSRWNWAKDHQPCEHFYVEPFSLEELLQGNMVQVDPVDEGLLRAFYTNYGPSARDCYLACRSQYYFDAHDEQIKRSIQNMSWELLGRIIADKGLTPAHSSSHFVVIIEPCPGDPRKPKVNVINLAIMRRLLQAHRRHIRQKGAELYEIFQQHPHSSTTAGWLYEALVHDMLERGISKPLHPEVQSNRRPRSDAQFQELTFADVPNGQWGSQCMNYVPFTEVKDQLKLEENSYYVPMDSRFPTFDSFTYQLVPFLSYRDPTILTHGDATSLVVGNDLPLFTVFQITISKTHDVNEKGLHYLIRVARHNGFDHIAIRYVAVVPPGVDITIRAPVGWQNLMSKFILRLSPHGFDI